MAKNYIGIDIGHKTLKLVANSGDSIRKAALAAIPDNLVKSGAIVSVEAMGDFIKASMKKFKIHGSRAALVLNNDRTFTKLVTMPLMTPAQITVNLPYEFSDYITDELTNYVFDYMVLSVHESDEGQEQEQSETPAEAVPWAQQEASETEKKETLKPKVMEIMAVAAQKEMLEEMQVMIKRAGLKFVKAAPVIYAFIGILRAQNISDSQKEICFLDIGQENIIMHMFKGERYIITRTLQIGLGLVENKIAEAENVDIHIAHTYFENNHGDCQNSELVKEAYADISVELQRAVNFYKFSNPDSNLNDIYVCGGGAGIKALVDEIRDNLGMNMQSCETLLKGKVQENACMCAQAYGITQD